MKIFNIIILLILSLNVFALEHYTRSNSFSCENNPIIFSGPKAKQECEKKYGQCSIIVGKFNCETHIVADEMVDDISKPNWSNRSMIEPCSGLENCQEISLNKECVDGRHSLYNAEYSEVWCAKIVDYQKKPSGKKLVKEDAVKKAAYLAAKQVEQDAKQAEKDSLQVLKTKLKDGIQLTPDEINLVLKYALKNIN